MTSWNDNNRDSGGRWGGRGINRDPISDNVAPRHHWRAWAYPAPTRTDFDADLTVAGVLELGSDLQSQFGFRVRTFEPTPILTMV